MMYEKRFHRTCNLSSRQMIYLTIVMLLALLALVPSKASAADNNDETVVIDGVSYHVLRSSADWTRLGQLVTEADGKSDVNAILDEDFTVTEPLPTNAPFRGIFDGNGHTLYLNIDRGTNNAGAPFLTAAGSTFRNLHVAGNVNGATHSSGLVSKVANTPNIYFESVWVSANVSTNSRYLGGFLAHSGNASVFMTDCRFDGKLSSTSNEHTYAGAFIGWGGEGPWTFHRVYEDGTYSVKGSAGGFCRDSSGDKWWGGNSRSTLCLSSHDWGEMDDSQHKNVKDQNEVVSRMNAEKPGTWQLVGNKAIPVMKRNGLEATFELYDMVPGTDSNELNMLKIPFSCDQQVKWIEANYIDEDGNFKNLGRMEMPKNTYAGFIKVPATEAHYNLTIRAKLLVGEVNVVYDKKNDAVMHNPRNLSAKLLRFKKDTLAYAGTMRLAWRIHNAKYNDVVNGDQFVVLRSLTGKMEDMEQIGSVAMESGDSIYTYDDNKLMEVMTQELLSAGTPQLKYIVIRASAQQLWGINNNVASDAVDYSVDLLHLLRIQNYTAKWEDQTEHTVKVEWQYADEYGAAWDGRAKMKMLVTSTNREGAPVDSTTYTLTADEMAKCSKVVSLHRSCVNYKIELFVDQSTSPLAMKGETYLEIRTEADWITFVHKVDNAHGNAVNAMLMADVSVTNMVGVSANSPFCGVFEGNGHALTFYKSDGNENYIAPFRYVKNATIRNLHTKGSISSSKQFIAGMIGNTVAGGEVVIESCHSSMEMISSVNGDATNGGLVAVNDAQLTIRNTKFDGSFKGENCYRNGGFVGWLRGKGTLENCFFAPDEINTMLDECATWARNPSNLTLINSYCTVEYNEDANYFVIDSEEDWNTFCSKVSNAKGAKSVNAVLLADISITEPVGQSNGTPYTGIFDGGGHTLNVNIKKEDKDNAAPFMYATNFTIKNLHVTGSVEGRNEVSGLVGSAAVGNMNTITNCRVSATVKGTNQRTAGFVGRNFGVKTVISDCLFDGKLIGRGNTSYGASFAVFTSYNAIDISNCLEHGTYEKFTAIGFCRDNATAFAFTEKNNWSFNNLAREANSKSAEELVDQMGSNWHLVNGVPVPIMAPASIGNAAGKTADELVTLLGSGYWKKDNDNFVVPRTDDKTQATIAEVVLPTFYYENLGKIDENSLVVQPQQCSVVLTWNNEGEEPVDYYEVWRSDVQDPDNFIQLATQLQEKQYEDKTTSPVHQYLYKVRGVNDCEGRSFTDTKVKEGQCEQTATASGFFRFLDGTGIPGQVIYTTLPDGQLKETTTDESGYYILRDLPYVNATRTEYTISTRLNGYSGSKTIAFGTGAGENVVKDIVLEVESSVKISGYVQYSGTSIPVQGVSFKVGSGANIYEVHTAAGKVTTDHEGKFSFRILPNQSYQIQAYKDGHKFYQDGYFYEDDKDTEKEHVFTTDKAGIYFYDDTRVKMIGRIAGGKEQGAIPLDNSLSRNNLGDDLQMVLTLEGDNASRLVWDIQDKNKKERDEEFMHNAHDKKYEYKTKVHTTINRMVVTPDVHTGEYMVMLPPVKWKIQQITAKGYPTLFQDGQMGDVVDLSDSLTVHSDTIIGSWKNADQNEVNKAVVTYHAKYNRIYHSPVLIDYKQQNFDAFDYFGDHYYSFKNISGDKAKLTLAYGVKKKDWPKGKRDSLETKYVFGYPVFSIDRKYPVKISATEKYYYNNNMKSDTVDVIRLAGGKVTIHNGMVSSIHKDTLRLDSVGEATYLLEAAQTPYLLTGSDALRTVSMTLEMDSTYYEAAPLRAYILNIQQLKGAKEILSYSAPQLVDILRDPPGGSSKATLSKGSTLKYSYQMDMTWSAGASLTIAAGSGLNSFTGVVAAPMGAGGVGGFNVIASNAVSTSIDLVWSGSGNRAFNYTMTTTEDISTSSDPKLVGANADLYIGVDQNIVVKPATAIRVIPDSIFVRMQGQVKSGRLLEIAQGLDDTGGVLHMVRDEVVTYGPVIKSNFVHSQQYIINQLLPSLSEQIYSLMFTGTKTEAQEQANATGEVVYWSKVDKDHKDFGTDYEVIAPSHATGLEINEVARYQNTMMAWAEMIGQNEEEKLRATELVQNYDLDGAGSVSYSESFTSEYSNTHSFVSPITPMTAQYFDSSVGNTAVNVAAILGPTVAKILGSVFKAKAGETKSGTGSGRDEDGHMVVEVSAVGVTFKFGLVPSMSFNVKPKDTETHSYSRKESFTIGMDKKSSLNFDVYRVKTASEGLSGYDDVFLSNDFFDRTEDNYEYLKRDLDLDNYKNTKSFVYRTRAGATCRPWENERKTLFYNPGTVLDERTKKIENPVIKMDKQSISGVPFGEPARFKLYLSNESEQPEAAYIYFNLYMNETTNPHGAKLMVDGMPLSGNGRTIEVHPGQVTEKTLEVYAGEAFDYEGLTIGFISLNDVDIYQEASFDVHYLQTAGAVAITTPGDKWIMNCDAPQENGKGWYMPVVISGFNKNQHNFDHIEFQYKESTRGDDYWTNLCGYYADSTIYVAASGTKEMIPENGNITTRFFGEGTVMEKAYDLRAVLFCRNGNSFLTYESKVLSGVKDTRRPELFGSPEPKDAVIGAGENIIFNFSEDIEYNYLQSSTNFQVMGETNESNILEAPSLLFGGSGYAYSEARRNFADKSVTIEVMIKPDELNDDMPIFSHGSDGKLLQLWVTKDKKLKAVVDDTVLVGNNVIDFKSFKRVALVLDNEKKKMYLYSDGQDAVLNDVTYSGYGQIVFGATNLSDIAKVSYFKGRMLQGRIWNRALDLATLNSYGNQLLTGYEMGLTDYYPMNEGSGNYATDLAQGAHLMLEGASWALPRGMSLKLDKNKVNEKTQMKGLQLKNEYFSEFNEEKDYTLMFWFRTVDKTGTLFSSGSGRKTDVGAKNNFFIGFEDQTLKYRTNGHEYELGDHYCDDVWHHYAMTVNRVRKVASIYLDNKLKAQFVTDSLGSLASTNYYLGNMVWQEEGLENDKTLQDNALTGYIDGFALFKQALPTTLIQRYSQKSPGGSEKGLEIYLDFDRQERQKNGDLVLQPYVLNKKVKYDNDGKVSDKHDNIFVEQEDVITQLVDLNVGAPVQAYEELRNLNFSFVGRDNQLLINIDEQDKRINKRNIYVTVADIPDKNGNFMSSPQTECFYVNRNPLTWVSKSISETMLEGQEYKIDLRIQNEGGAAHTYTIENLPRWMTVNKTTDIVEAQGTDIVTVTISKDINVGSYDHIIYLADEDGLLEPLAMELTVEGEEPFWAVDQKMKRYSMNVVAQVFVGNTLVTDSRDQVAAFDAKGRCMGVSNVKYDTNTGRSMVYLTVYDSTTVANQLSFNLWHYTTGKVMQLTASQLINFEDQSIVGSVANPIQMHADDLYQQKIILEEGWNWVSFNVYNAALRQVSTVLNMFPWKEGDIVTEDSEDLTLVYKNGRWMSNTDKLINKVSLSQEFCYRVKVQEYHEIDIWGTCFRNPDQRTIHLEKGWNSIGYTPMVNLPVATALTEYFDEATPGDVIKNQHEFAMFTSDGAGSGEWLGSLEYLKPGQGYMLYRQKDENCSFRYPYYEPGSTFIDMGSSRAARFATTMNVVAEAIGVDLEEGDRLVAYAGGEEVGLAELKVANSQLFYLSIEGDQQAPLSFAIERDGEIIAMTDEAMTYEADAIMGTPSEPTQINFVLSDQLPQEGWYTLQGIKLQNAPTKSGVYIYNGHKQVIK